MTLTFDSEAVAGTTTIGIGSINKAFPDEIWGWTIETSDADSKVTVRGTSAGDHDVRITIDIPSTVLGDFTISVRARGLRNGITLNTVYTMTVTAAEVDETGEGAGIFDGIDSYIVIPDHDDFQMGTNLFTIDFWLRLNDKGVSPPFPGTSHNILSHIIDDGVNPTSQFQFYYRIGGTENTLIASVTWRGGAMFQFTPRILLDFNTWYHIAFINGWGGIENHAALCVNGVAIEDEVHGLGNGEDTWTNMNSKLYIGAHASVYNADGVSRGFSYTAIPDDPPYYFRGEFYLDGYLDDLRWSKGIARWTENFTPPAEPHVADEYDILLLSFNGEQGSTIITDSTGRHNPVAHNGASISTVISKF